MAELTDEQFEAAKRRGEERLRTPRAVAARYDAGRGRVIIALSTGIELGLAPRNVEGLAGASAEDLRIIEVEGMGLGVHFSRLNADLYAPVLLEGVLGSRRWMTARLGAAGEQARPRSRSQKHARTAGGTADPAKPPRAGSHKDACVIKGTPSQHDAVCIIDGSADLLAG